MLTSSDAKFRCLWHMFIWSIMLTLVSQFLSLTDHIAFYIFGALCNIILPVVTSVYSTTSGRRGAGLLRVSYVVCDPVLACISIVPILLLNRLPPLVHELVCLGETKLSWNETISCLQNKSTRLESMLLEKEPSFDQKFTFWQERKSALVVIQVSIIFPIILALSMGRRTRKMNLTTNLFVFCYWLVVGIESVGMIEIAMLDNRYVHFIYSTQMIVSISMIITNSYAIITLCSYISPMGCRDENVANKRFDFLYKALTVIASVVFVEIPQLAARFQIMAAGPTDPNRLLPGVFYLWALKDGSFIVIIAGLLILQKWGPNRFLDAIRVPCAASFDNPDVLFQPEKRDAYIVRHKHELRKANEALLSEIHDGPNTEKHSTAYAPIHGGRKKKHVTFSESAQLVDVVDVTLV